MAGPWFREFIRRWGWYVLFFYLILLVASHFYLAAQQRSEAKREQHNDKKVVQVDNKKLAYLEWGGAAKELPPLILLHGSPAGGAKDWMKFAPLLAVSGRRIIAIDRWGFGDSEPVVDDYSFEADRKAVLGLMDSLEIKRAHVGGWSYGSGAAILLGDKDRERIVSVSLIAGIGIQEGEGSGSYMIEHGKYFLLDVLVNWLPKAIPHFGLLGPRSFRRSFARDFMDCDQRLLRSKLGTLEVPLFMIHGKNDPLVPAWVAQEHHRLQAQSRLVLLDSSHFFPFGLGGKEQMQLAAEELNTFLGAADHGRAADHYGARNETSRRDMRALWDDGPALRGYKPWWIVVLAGVVIGFVTPRSGGVLAGLAGGLLVVDFVTGFTGVVLGSIIRRGESRTRFHRAVMVALCGILGLIPGALLLPVF